MSSQIYLNDKLHHYLSSVSLREPSILAELRATTARMDNAVMQIGPEQGQFMRFLLQLMGARRYLEVGTFTGYSALACALALPEDGEVFALDRSAEWTSVAQEFWQRAGVAERIKLILGDAADTLEALLPAEQGSFDCVFIDADKTGYALYIDFAHQLLRTGGLILLDNVLWDGAVADENDSDPDTVALRQLNLALKDDERFELSMVAVGDGLTLLLKR